MLVLVGDERNPTTAVSQAITVPHHTTLATTIKYEHVDDIYEGFNPLKTLVSCCAVALLVALNEVICCTAKTMKHKFI
jgi:hypothetical protein